VALHQLALRHADLRIDDPVRRQRLTASLAEVGQQVAVVVVAEGARFVLIDGYRRVEALRRLGRDTVTATAVVAGRRGGGADPAPPFRRGEPLGAGGGVALGAAARRAGPRARRAGAALLPLEALGVAAARAPRRAARRAAGAGAGGRDPAAGGDAVPGAVGPGHPRTLRAVALAAVGETRLSGATAAPTPRGAHAWSPTRSSSARPSGRPRPMRRAAATRGRRCVGIAWRAAQRGGQGARGAVATDRQLRAWRAAESAFTALRDALQVQVQEAGDARPDDAGRDSPAA
jgi:ParB-like nuclease family protein